MLDTLYTLHTGYSMHYIPQRGPALKETYQKIRPQVLLQPFPAKQGDAGLVYDPCTQVYLLPCLLPAKLRL